MKNTGKSRKELLDELEGLRRQFADLQVSQDRLRQAEEASRGALKDAQQKQAENVALLKAVRALLEHREFKAYAQAIFDSCKSIIGATAGYIALLSSDGTSTSPVFIDTGGASCAVDPSLPMPTRGLRAEAYRQGKAVYDNNFARSEHMKFVPGRHITLDSVLFAPLISEGKPVGLLGLANKPGGFTENDARLTTWFGDVASVALLNSRALELLQQSDERWHLLIQTAVDAVITTDSRGKIIVWNRGAELAFGYSADEAIGKTIGLIIPEQLRKSHEEGINRVVSGGKPKIIGKTTECVGLRKDGSEFPLELTLSTWKQGAEMFFTAIVRDITQRKQAEEKSKTIIQTAMDGFWLVDTQGRLVDVNNAYCQLTGYTRDELLNMRVIDLEAKETAEETAQHIQKVLKMGSDHFESKHRCKDGRIVDVEASVNYLPGKDERFFVFVRDITQRRQAEVVAREKVRLETEIVERKQAEEELKQHYDMEGVINSLLRFSLEEISLEEVLRKALDSVLSIPWLSFESRGAMFLVEAEPEVLVMKAQKGLAEPIQRACARIPFGRCLCGRAALTREVQFADTMDDRHETRYEGMTPHGHYCVPILSVDRVVGVLCVYTREGHRRNQREEEFMTAVANTLAGVIERKRTAKRLEKSKAMLAEAQSMAHIGSWQLDIVSNVLTWSDEVYRMFGLEPQQFRASYEAFLDNIHPDDKEMVNQAYTDSVRNRTPYSIVHRLLLKDGTIKYVEERGETLYNADGQPLRSIGIVQDITERKKAEDALRQSEEKFAKAFRLGPEAMSIIELESGRIIDVNENYARLIGYKLEEIIGHTVFELAIYKRFEERTATIKILKEKERYHNFEMTILTKSGEERTCLVSAELLRFGQQDLALGVYKDITERKKMEEKLLIADRLASIGQLASGIAHELNNPLTSVIGFSEMLLKRDLPDDVKDDLKIVNDQAKRTAQIVKGLLTFARKQKTEKEPLDISSLIQNVLQLRSYEHRVSNIEVNTRFAPDLPEITGNGAQLQQVFINLIVNAEQAMLEAHGRGRLIITTEKMGDMVRVSFTDDGPGISPENMRKLFSPFFTTKEVGKGTGLGLSICHGIVTEHGGRIYAESELGKGATFVVELPVSKQ